MTDELTGAAPLVEPPPSVDPRTASDLAARLYDVDGTVTELGGERDRNFRIDTETGESYVLKVSNPADGPGVLDLQTQAIRHLAETDPELPVMRVVPTTDGADWASVDIEDVGSHGVRLFTHCPGRRATPTELDHDALYHYGRGVARVGQALRGFFHADARYDVLWDLRHTPELRSLVGAVDDPQRAAVAENVLDRFESRVDPVFDSLRAQVIHNDLTLDNVLLDEADRISGIVDFGDLTHTALVCDVAMAVASAMFGREDPIEAARSVIAGYVSVTPLEDEEARVLWDLVAARFVAWGVIAAWRVERYPENEAYITAGEDVAWELLRSLEDLGDAVVSRRLRTAALATEVPYARSDTASLVQRRRGVMGQSPLSYRDPVHFVAGEGTWLFDTQGRRYLDAYNNVQVVGHGDPDVAAAIAGQTRKLTTNSRYLHEAPVSLAERLVESMPDGLDTVVFVNSGSEATDLAWRLATAATGRTGAVVSNHAYHGITEAATALSPEVWPDGHRPGHVETIPPPGHSGSHGAAERRDHGGAMARAVTALDQRGTDPAAFVFDSLFTSDGIHPATADGLGVLVDRVRGRGGLVVADEVQAGFGRTGSQLWGFQAADVVPDVVTLGKPMGNGYPVAAVVTREELATALMDRTGVFSTYGGNPVACTAALAVLDAIEDRDLLAATTEVGAYLAEGLSDLAAEHELITDVRAAGLMVGVELGRDGSPASSETTAVVNELRQRRVLIGETGRDGNVLKIRPPLVFERRHADHLLEALDTVLTERG